MSIRILVTAVLTIGTLSNTAFAGTSLSRTTIISPIIVKTPASVQIIPQEPIRIIPQEPFRIFKAGR
jgi:hypothetical protein